jgi:hypothetical protein
MALPVGYYSLALLLGGEVAIVTKVLSVSFSTSSRRGQKENGIVDDAFAKIPNQSGQRNRTTTHFCGFCFVVNAFSDDDTTEATKVLSLLRLLDIFALSVSFTPLFF